MTRVSHSLFGPDALAEELAGAYSLSAPVNCALVSPGVNDTYQVGEEHFYRVYRAGLRSPSDVQFELALLCHLQREGAAVSVPVPRVDGSYITHHDAPEGERMGVLFTRAPGRVLAYVEEDAYQYGCAVARLHIAMDSFRTEWVRFRMDLEHLLEKPLRLMQPYATLEQWGFYEQLADRLRARVVAVAPDLEQGICHGDLHGHNVHKAEDGTLTFFDFDCGGPGWRAYDLAVYRWAVGRHAQNMHPWEEFLRGYRTLREVRQVDLEITPVFAAIRTYWLLGLQVQQVHQRGTAHVHMWLEGAAQFLRRYAETELG